MSGTQLRTPGTGLPVTSLLVALDGSAFTERAVAPARRLATALGAPLHLWSAAPTPVEAENRRARIQQLAEACGASWEVVVSARPVEAISGAGDRAGRPLLCLATHGRDRTAPLVHSVAAAVVAASDGPLLLVGPEVPADPAPGRKLAVCVDGGPESELILVAAMAWARALGLAVEVITVAEPVPESVLHPGSYGRLHGPHGDAQAYVDGVAAAWRGDVPVTGTAIYDPVDVDGALVTALTADRPELVVMGTKAPLGLRRMILGSTAAAVSHGSPAPVLVVPV